jgi:DnaJ-class molecular chaperone
MSENYYFILGVNKGSSPKKIKDAYRREIKKYHPDLSQNETTAKKFRELREAYETLGDEKKRKEYDKKISQRRSSIRDLDHYEAFDNRKSFYQLFDEFYSDTDDFFSGFVPGFYERSQDKGKDLYIEIILTPKEAFEGCIAPISVPVIEPCPRCGKSSIWEVFFCPVCLGRGRVSLKREFSLVIPPHVNDGTEAKVSMDDIGLKHCILNVLISIDTRFTATD